jgi:hypothetical protein
VFYGIDDDPLDLVKLLTIKFSVGAMFWYLVGGWSENRHLVSLTRKECRRLN